MFAILATNMIGNKMGYCEFDIDIPTPDSKYGVNQEMVIF